MRLAAVVLAGGGAVRLDGADKASVQWAGATLLAHVLRALVAADEVVVVGPVAETERPVSFTREEPAGGGPVAGLVAGYAALTTDPDLLAVAAVDMPRLTAATFDRLTAVLSADEAAAGAFLTSDGRRHLAGVLRPALLPWPSGIEAHGMPMHRLLAPLRLVDVPAAAGEAHDIDTWADLGDP